MSWEIEAHQKNMELMDAENQHRDSISQCRAKIRAIEAENAALRQENQAIRERYSILWTSFKKLVRQFGLLGRAASDVYDNLFEEDDCTELRYLRRAMKVNGVMFTRKSK